MHLGEKLADRHQRILYAEWELTRACPWRCVHCYLGNRSRTRTLSLARCEHVLDELREAGVLWLLLTGGEPTVHPHFWELISCARRRAFRVRLFSNLAHLSMKQVDRLAGLGFEAIEATLMGSTPKLHDQLVRAPGSYRKLLTRVERLKKRGVRVHLKTVYIPANMHDLGGVKSLAERMGCAYAESWRVVSRIDTRLVPDCGSLSAEAWLDLLGKTQVRPGARKKRKQGPCGAGVSLWALDETANVYPCLIFRRNCGNLLADSWRKVYAGPLLRALRRNRHNPTDVGACASCLLRKECWRCMGQAWLETGNYRAPYPDACSAAAAQHRYSTGRYLPPAYHRRHPHLVPTYVSDARMRRLKFSAADIRKRATRSGIAT